MLKHQANLEAVIRCHAPTFTWGKRWGGYGGDSITSNIVVGYIYSKSWWYRVFRRSRLNYECALLELALYDWLSITQKVTYSFIHAKWPQHNGIELFDEFTALVVDAKIKAQSIFENAYIKDMYFALNANGFVKTSVAERYHRMVW